MTISELKRKLEYYGIPDEWYCLDGYAEGCYGIHYKAGKWIVHVCERGKTSGFEEFSTETDACEYLLGFLRRKLERMKNKKQKEDF